MGGIFCYLFIGVGLLLTLGVVIIIWGLMGLGYIFYFIIILLSSFIVHSLINLSYLIRIGVGLLFILGVGVVIILFGV